MPRSLVLLLVLGAGCDTRPTPPPAAAVRGARVDEVKAAILRRDKDLTRVVVFPTRGSDECFVAICDTQFQWWGRFECVRVRDGQVGPAAQADVVPTEQSIRSVRAFVDPLLGVTLVEVLGITHMGNGSCYLYEWKDNALRLLLETSAVDCHDNGWLIRGGVLKRQYADLNGDGHTDVVFSGIIDKTDEVQNEELVVRCHVRQKVFHWDATRRRFVEDESRRLGPKSGRQ